MDKPVANPQPPTAPRRPFSYVAHGVTIEDPWAWLRDPKYPAVTDPEILSYLKAENAFFDGWKARHQPLLDTLFEEMRGRIKEDDSSVPIKDGDWLYWWAFRPGAEYRTWYRRKIVEGSDAERPSTALGTNGEKADTKTPFVPSEVEGRVSTECIPSNAAGGVQGLDTDGQENQAEIIYDEPAEAEGKEYFVLGAMEVSPDHKLMATLVDDNGSERFSLRIRDLATGKDIETITEVGIGQPTWSNDSKGVLFTEVNDQWRSYRARYHRLGADPATSVTLYEETEDLGFSVGIGKSQDESLIFIGTGDNTTSEVRFVSADDPSQPLTLVSPRQANREYDVDAGHGKLWILTNDDHINFRLAEADPATPEQWTTVIAGSDDIYLTDVTPYRDWLAVTRRVGGLDQLALRTYAGEEMPLPFEEASFTAYFHGNPEFAPANLRVGYSSMVTPTTVFDFHPETRSLEVRKVQEIPSGYDASLYATERLEVVARDGTRVPVSVVTKKGFPRDGSGRLFLYAYGAYGHAIAPTFNSNRLSLLDRGFACAIAHIRGGDDLGYGWFLDGKLMKRTNTFNDFVDVAKGLVEAGFASAGRIGINGGSAGGELMGAVANSNPELWGAVVADVPFVDVLSTMLDDTLPLTPGEWPEWGNPIVDEAVFHYIRGYSPYDNVTAQDYPPMLITGGISDPRVTYWEPAKWAARLRATKTDDNLLLLKTNMGAGHGGKSGRWESLKEVAETYAFVLTQIDSSPSPAGGRGPG